MCAGKACRPGRQKPVVSATRVGYPTDVLKYSVRFLAAIFRPWYTLVTLGLNVVGIIALAAGDIKFLTKWWPLLPVALLFILLVASFQAYRQEAAKNESKLRMRLTWSVRSADYVPCAAHFYIYPGGLVKHFVKLYARFANYGDEVRINKMWLFWKWQDFMDKSEVRIPCRKVEEVMSLEPRYRDADWLDIVLGHGEQTEILELDFEGSTRTFPIQRSPKHSSYWLYVDVIGGPSLSVKLADFAVKSWDVQDPLQVEPSDLLPTLNKPGSPVEEV